VASLRQIGTMQKDPLDVIRLLFGGDESNSVTLQFCRCSLALPSFKEWWNSMAYKENFDLVVLLNLWQYVTERAKRACLCYFKRDVIVSQTLESAFELNFQHSFCKRIPPTQ